MTSSDISVPTDYPKVFKAKVENGIKLEVIQGFVDDIFTKNTEELIEVLCGFVPCAGRE
jgi:hypothetical protein